MDSVRADKRVIVAQLPYHRTWTVYSAIGDSAGWLAVAGFVAVVVLAIRRGRQSAATPGVVRRRPA